VVEVVVEERARSVRRRDRVDVAREVEVDVLHRHDCRGSPRRAPFTPKTGPIEGCLSVLITLARRASRGEGDVGDGLPSPRGVGVIAVTTMYLPSGGRSGAS